jgi:hypothetical protein
MRAERVSEGSLPEKVRYGARGWVFHSEPMLQFLPPKKVQEFLSSIQLVPYPLYSSDLTPANFFLSPTPKK